MLSPRTARGNRVGLAVVGVLLVIGGLYCLGQTQNVFFAHSAARPLLTGAESRFARTNGWFWIVAAIVAAVVAVICLRWLAVQFRHQRVGIFRLEPQRKHGGTRMAAELLTDAVENEIGSYPDVHRVSAQLTGAARHPDLRLNVSLEPRADISRVRSRIEAEAVPRLRQALELEEIPVLITLRVD